MDFSQIIAVEVWESPMLVENMKNVNDVDQKFISGFEVFQIVCLYYGTDL